MLWALPAAAEEQPGEAQEMQPSQTLRLDYAPYNPLSLALKSKRWLEDAVGSDVRVEWSSSLSCGRAIDRLRVRSLDLASSSASATLLQRANGASIKAVYVYSRPEWSALVVRKDSPIRSVQDLKGRRVAAIVRTEPGLFLVRALATQGMSEHDVTIVPLQDLDGRIALDLGQVDAWAGFDPYMAQAELETHDVLLFRNRDLDSAGVLDVRESFLSAHPDLVRTVVQAYERTRQWAVSHRDELAQILAADAKISPGVAARQLDRSDFSDPGLGEAFRHQLAGAGDAIKLAGLVGEETNLSGVADAMVDPEFTAGAGTAR